MVLGTLIGLAASEIGSARRSMRRTFRRVAVRTGAWVCTLAVLMGAFTCFTAAMHVALRSALSPLAAWLITGGALLLIGMGAVITLLVAGHSRSNT